MPRWPTTTCPTPSRPPAAPSTPPNDSLLVAGRFADQRPSALDIGTVAVTALSLVLLWIFRDAAGGVVVAMTVWGVAFGAAPVLWQLIAVRAAPAAASVGPAVVNAALNVGIALGALGAAHRADVNAPTAEHRPPRPGARPCAAARLAPQLAQPMGLARQRSKSLPPRWRSAVVSATGARTAPMTSTPTQGRSGIGQGPVQRV